MLSNSGRPRKACNECKGQKAACSGERPKCKRCARLNHECIYDSKTLHSRSPHTYRHHPAIRQRDLVPASRPNIPQNASSSNDTTGRVPNAMPLLDPATVPSDTDFGLPSSLIDTLVETYFTCVYNANLLLHKGLFLEQLAANRVPGHLLMSICAWGSVFYHDSSQQRSLHNNGFSRMWAEKAGTLLFREIEEPSPDNIATCINLCLFWYSQGEWRRSCMHAGMGTQTALILGIGFEKTPINTWEAEVQRRRFWACYCIDCHGLQTSLTPRHLNAAMNLALPWAERDFEGGVPSAVSATLTSTKGNSGVFAEVIRGLRLWAEVRDFMKSTDSDMSKRTTIIQTLDNRISEWWSACPAEFLLSAATISTVDQVHLPRLFLIVVLYHQSLCALHSSIIPLFCGSAGNDDGWSFARQLSAQKAFDHACQASDLMDLTHRHMGTARSIPSFVAYAAYCASAIQMPFLWCQQDSVKMKVQDHLKTNVKLIRSMAQYWKFAEVLNLNIQYLYKIYAKEPTVVESEPLYLNPARLMERKIKTHNARMTILGHNSILWSENQGYVRQSDEIRGLEEDEDSSDNARSMEQTPLSGQSSQQQATPGQQAYNWQQDLPNQGNKTQLPHSHQTIPFDVMDSFNMSFVDLLEPHLNSAMFELNTSYDPFILPTYDADNMGANIFMDSTT